MHASCTRCSACLFPHETHLLPKGESLDAEPRGVPSVGVAAAWPPFMPSGERPWRPTGGVSSDMAGELSAALAAGVAGPAPDGIRTAARVASGVKASASSGDRNGARETEGATEALGR